MNAMRPRPLAYAVLSFALGILLGWLIVVPILAAWVLIGIGAIVLFVPAVAQKRWCFCLVLVVFGVWRYAMTTPTPQLSFARPPTLVRVRGILLSSYFPCAWFTEAIDNPTTVYYRNPMYMRLQQVCIDENWVDTEGKARIIVLGFGEYWKRGDRVEVLATMERIAPASNPGQFDARSFYDNRGVFYRLKVVSPRNIRILERSCGCPLLNFFSHLRLLYCEMLLHQLGKREGSVAIALFLGERRFLPKDLYEGFRASGTMHLLAISGLHVSLLAAIVFSLCRQLCIRYHWARLAIVAILAAYSLLTGLQGPVLRAALMISSYLLAPLLGRQADFLNCLAFAAFAILLDNPRELFLPGFQLSFAACLAIWWTLQSIPRVYQKRRAVMLFAVSLAAWLGTMPLIVYHFGTVPLIGWLVSIVLLPLVIAGIVSTVLLLFSPLGMWQTPQCLAQWGWQACIWIVDIAAAVPNTALRLAPPPWLAVLAFFILAAYLVRNKYKYPLTLLALAIVLFSGPCWQLLQPRYSLTMLDMGHGSAIYIKLGNRHLLYDCGSQSPAAARRLLDFFQSRGITHLDALILSHYDSDHYNALEQILPFIEVKKIFVNQTLWLRGRPLILRLARFSLQWQIVADHTHCKQFREVEFLYPGQHLRDYAGDNEHSLMVLLTLGSKRVLLTGDIEEKAVDILLQQRIGNIDVLQVPHHGAFLANTQQLLTQTRPQMALVSARRGFSDYRTLAVYHNCQIPLWTTYRCGAVEIASDGEQLTASGFLRDP